jgi:hypothetical protein
MKVDKVIDRCFAASKDVRYVAVYIDGDLSSRERAGLSAASSSDSDKYEELLVNPTLIKLASQRGNIDCGGLKFLLVRYGNFFQFIYPLKNGHVSVALEPSCDTNSISQVLMDAIEQGNV